MRTSLKAALLAAGCVSAWAGIAQAQTKAAAPSTLEEIVVTARKRTESLQNVPVAVAAISQAEIVNHNVSDLAKLAELAPQVMIGRQTNGTGAILTIRGISSAAADAGLDQSVLVSIDGMQISRGRIINAALFDVAQVEVLEGPQALFFGKNSPAGVISITSQDPTSTFSGYVRGGYEFEAQEYFSEGAVSGPITDTLKGRFAYRISDMRGYIKNIGTAVADPFHPGVTVPGATYGRWGPDNKDITVRTSLAWNPTEDFDAKFKLTWGHEKLNAMDAYVEPFCVGTTTPTLLGKPLPATDCTRDKVKAESSLASVYAVNFPYDEDGVPYAKSSILMGSLNLDKRLDHVTLTSTTGYYLQKYQGANDADFSAFAEIWSSQHETFHLFTQELRANTEFEGPLNGMAGAYFEHGARSWFNAADLFHGGKNAFGNWASFVTTAHGTWTSYSFFAQGRWNIMPNLELAGGARYSHDKKSMEYVNVIDGVTSTPLRAQGVPLDATYSDDNVSPEVTLTYHPQTDQTLYVAYKTGYKSGGLSNQGILGPTATEQTLRFGHERSKGFEGGYKAEMLDRTLRFDLIAYRYNYNGLQIATFNSQILAYTTGNAARARTTGVQGSFKWLATQDLSFRGNLGYNKAKYLSYPTAQCYGGQTAATGCIPAVPATATTPAVGAHQDLSGQPLVRAPELTFMLGADYKAELPGGWMADLSADTTHTGKYQAQPDNAPGGWQKSYWMLNASARLSPANDRYSVSLIGRNLTNTYYMISSVSAPARSVNEYIGIFNRPREIVLQAEYRWSSTDRACGLGGPARRSTVGE
jgi:outer membrane receptor protein involved in Fe transport